MYQEEITGVRGEAPQEKILGRERATEAPFKLVSAGPLPRSAQLKAPPA